MQNAAYAEKRIFPRFPVNIPLFFLQLASSNIYTAVTHDISTQGLCLVVDRQVLLGTELDIHLQMKDNNEKISLKGKVVWSDMVDIGKYKIGIQLEETKLKPIPLVLRTIMAQRKY